MVDKKLENDVLTFKIAVDEFHSADNLQNENIIGY